MSGSLEATLMRTGWSARRDSLFQMLALSAETIETRALKVAQQLEESRSGLKVTVVSGNSAVGGGSGQMCIRQPRACPVS